MYQQHPPPPDAPDLISPEGQAVEKHIRTHAREFTHWAVQGARGFQPFIYAFLKDGADYRAASIIFNQAASDYMSLINELAIGNGRSAVRTARSLIEHAVNLADVINDTDSAERYVAHLAFEAEYSAKFELGLDLLSDREQRKARSQTRHYLRKVAAQLQSSIAKYGSKFRLSWSEANLRDRAVKYNLDYLYPAYKLTSLVIHGASGGQLGLTKQIEFRRVVRTGPAIYLCPFAYIAGIKAMTEIMQQVSNLRKDLDAQVPLFLLGQLTNAWPEYLDAARKADKATWPTKAPLPPMAILAVAANGHHRWYWHSIDKQLIIEADPPKLNESYQKMVDDVINEVKENPDRYTGSGRRFATALFLDHFPVTPRKNGKVMHDSTLNIRRDEFASMRGLESLRGP
jgi:hypothetical protein